MLLINDKTMSRDYCQRCLKPQISCICQFMTSIANSVEVIILQHPSEVKQSKATVPLLAGSLAKCHVFIGEDFEHNEVLQTMLGQYTGQVALLYPSDVAHVISANKPELPLQSIRCLVLLDGTWKKAYRLYQLNTFLHAIPHFALSDEYLGQYLIRKTKKSGALSTLEACCYALSMFENSNERYQPLLEKFLAFNQFQQRFVPNSPSQNHKNKQSDGNL